MDFVLRNGKIGFAGKLFLDGVDDVMRHERLAVIFADVAVRGDAGFRAQIARELAAVIVFNDDDVFAARKEPGDFSAVWNGTIHLMAS